MTPIQVDVIAYNACINACKKARASAEAQDTEVDLCFVWSYLLAGRT